MRGGSVASSRVGETLRRSGDFTHRSLREELIGVVRRLVGSEREVFQRKRRAVVYQPHVGLVRRTDRGELGDLPKVLEENEGDQLLFGDGDWDHRRRGRRRR